MHVLRNAPRLARLLLACFVLSLGVAMASPWVQAGPLNGGWERVCSASGEERWVAVSGNTATDTDSTAHRAHTLDCALCLPFLLPPPDGAALHGLGQPAHMFARSALRQTHVPALSRAPLPARGPPGASSTPPFLG
ncbi:DUF2946 family protein [Diaphorobacter sp.]|uniref:DUF2946 family protein n=1 Tax=Diaphorobacter sp. TaxID=1934310 RepID=UPI003D127479